MNEEYMHDGLIYIKSEFRRPKFGEFWVRNYKTEVRLGPMKMKVWILKVIDTVMNRKANDTKSELTMLTRARQIEQGYTPCFNDKGVSKVEWCVDCTLEECDYNSIR